MNELEHLLFDLESASADVMMDNYCKDEHKAVMDFVGGLEKAARRVVKSNADGYLPHALICNYQEDSCEFCNCGIANLKTALRKTND